jgi:hypothetical protein
MAHQRKVTVTAKRNGSKIDFEMEEKGHYTELLLFNKNDDGIKKTDTYDIIFDLKPDPGVNVEFVQDKGDVMYVSKGSNSHVPKCPKNANGNPQTPFAVTSVSATQLTVNNPDNDVCFYKFALRFIDKDNGNAIVTFDPIYGNQNGGRSLVNSATTAAFIGGAGGAAIGALFAIMALNMAPVG